MNADYHSSSATTADENGSRSCESVEQCNRGSQISNEAIEKLKEALFNRAAARAPSGIDAIEFGKDLAQQAICRAWRWFEQGKNQRESDLIRTAHCILAWLLKDEYRRTAQRQATQSLDQLKKEAGDSLSALTANEPLPDEILHRKDIEALVARALAKLSDPDQRKVLELRFWAGKSNTEIAAALGVSERTIIRRYLEAESALRRQLRLLSEDINQ